MSYERTTKDSVGYIANKFAENPGHFAATILRMYWDMEKQRYQYKAERDTLIDDLAVVRANNKRLEQELKRRREEERNLEAKLSAQLSMKRDLEKENKHLKERINKAEELIKGNIETLKMYGGITSKNYELEKENKALRLQADTYFDEWQTVKKQYTTLTNHIRMKAEANPGVSRYIDLINHIDRLERD
ncbi:hypothetical protein ABLV98_15525 [Staphylococcus sp. 50Mo3-1]|uniref:hypothetical protein n=1 Tax=Staphylococcus sp. 50Mo3-2 TaxID=3135642 RepID=UPI0033ED43BF